MRLWIIILIVILCGASLIFLANWHIPAPLETITKVLPHDYFTK